MMKKTRKVVVALLVFGALWMIYINRWDLLNAKEFGLTNPQTGVLGQIRNAERDSQDVIATDIYNKRTAKNAAEIAHSSDPGDAFHSMYSPHGRRSYSLHVGAQKTIAENLGIRLSERPDAVIQSNLAKWQVANCLNVGANRYEPCEFFPGDVIEGFGEIVNDHVKLVSTGQTAQIEPTGLADRTNVTLPIVASLPRFALLGQIVDAAGNEIGKPFVIGRGYEIQTQGYLKAMVNGDYFYCYGGCSQGQPWPHPEWFNNNHGNFGLRIRRNSSK